jgi:hypothetical protein
MEDSTGVARVLTAAREYAAPNLNPSTYTVRAEFMGFQDLVCDDKEVFA